MSKMKVSEYFNPNQHLTFHQDKEGNMIGGGYQVNNLMYQHKMPLFVSLGDGNSTQSMMGGSGAVGGGGDGHDEAENRHFIPEKFSDLFRDLAVPAGLFMMPAMFKPRNYACAVPDDDDTKSKKSANHDRVDGDNEDESSESSDSDQEHTKTVPNDIFDTLLALVTPSERIQHDVKTRRSRQSSPRENKKSERKRQNKTRRGKGGMME
jgi:hypothetical protein